MSTRENLDKSLQEIITFCATLNLEKPQECKKSLAEKYPITAPLIQEVFQLTQKGMEEGWICHRENGGIRFSRVVKPDNNEEKFSVDAVLMEGPGPKHTHPLGEIDLCFQLAEDPQFDGNPPGWTIYPPNSTHIPTVAGGKMFILYFLPEGQIEFHRE